MKICTYLRMVAIFIAFDNTIYLFRLARRHNPLSKYYNIRLVYDVLGFFLSLSSPPLASQRGHTGRRPITWLNDYWFSRTVYHRRAAVVVQSSFYKNITSSRLPQIYLCISILYGCSTIIVYLYRVVSFRRRPISVVFNNKNLSHPHTFLARVKSSDSYKT